VSPSGGYVCIVDSYSESNVSGYYGTSEPFLSTFEAQSFTGNGGTLASVKFYVKKIGSPTANAYAFIHTHTGTFGTNGTPTGSALATSDGVAYSGISTSATLVEFTFSGANKITLTNGTRYFVAITSTQTSGNGLDVGVDETSPSHAGNQAYFDGMWVSVGGADDAFYVYADSV
jgi:hypothetical protein